MKYKFIILVYLNTFACMTSSIKLNYPHANASSAEFFINHTGEQFVEDEIEKRSWVKSNLILRPYHFRSKQSSTIIHILFFNSQADAIVFEAANKFEGSDTLKSVINGAVLYLIDEAEEDKASKLLGLFAGEE